MVLDGSKTREPDVRPHLRELIPYVTILICGEGFGRALSGVEGLYEAGERILEMGPSIVVQTEGADGSYTVTRDERLPGLYGRGGGHDQAATCSMAPVVVCCMGPAYRSALFDGSALKCMGLGGRA